MQVSIGGERLGSGNKNKVNIKNFERTTVDLSFVWRSTMSAGTLVPFMNQFALAGDTWDINLDCVMLSHPTIGPLFGLFKVQLDVFITPVSKFQGELRLNQNGVGLDMEKIKLPILKMEANDIDKAKPIDNQQINPSCIFKYLGISGLGHRKEDDISTEPIRRDFNALGFLTYWATYKQYYANKQEEIGVAISKQLQVVAEPITAAVVYGQTEVIIPLVLVSPIVYKSTIINVESYMVLLIPTLTGSYDWEKIYMNIKDGNGVEHYLATWEFWRDAVVDVAQKRITYRTPNPRYNGTLVGFGYIVGLADSGGDIDNEDLEPKLRVFPLKNIDDMQKRILRWDQEGVPVPIRALDVAPYCWPLQGAVDKDGKRIWTKNYSQEGLAIKTYQSDIYNNWINTDWIDGVGGINEVTAVDVTDGKLILDEFLIQKKIYSLLNNIAISGGTYDNWQEVVYGIDRVSGNTEPAYIGGLIKDMVFQEVISTAETQAVSGGSPLGSLAGRGKMGGKHKGGRVTVKVTEASYIQGIISLTPYIDYSQGNAWDGNLRNMNDFHKPQLDQIGFQELITDGMMWADTECSSAGVTTYRSAGKQPAWLNYMTNVNKVYGNFADQYQQMFMVLNRRYEMDTDGIGMTIKDLTTYIDPVKFNFIFADTRRDAQNFWAQISVDCTVRRKMSGKIMPNL